MQPRGTHRGRLELDYRPLRRIYSVPSDLDAFRAVVRVCSSLWGGALDFIAVEYQDGMWDALTRDCILTASAIDELVVVGADTDARVASLRSFEGRQPRASRIALPWPRGTDVAGLLPTTGMVPPFRHGSELPWSSMVELPQGRELPNEYAIAFGEVARPATRPTGLGYRHHYLSQWSPFDVSALSRTVAGVRAREDWLAAAALTLVPLPAPDALRQLAWTWNIRAALWPSDNGVGLLPLFDAEDDLNRVRTDVRAWFHRFPEWRRRVVLVVADDAEPTGLGSLAESVFRTPPAQDDSGSPTYPDLEIAVSRGSPELPEAPVALSAHHAEHLVFEAPDGLAVTLSSSLEDTPGWCALDIAGDPRLRLPRRASLAKTVHPNATLATDRGLSVLVSPNVERTLDLRIPQAPDLVFALLSEAGLDSEPSSVARHIVQLYRALDGDLSRDNPLRDGTAIDILRELDAARSSAGMSDRTLAQLYDRLRSDVLDSRLRRERVWRCVNALVRRRVLFAGIRVFCASCELRHWRIVDDLGTEMICSGCRASIRFPGTGTSSDVEPTWSYVLNDAFSSLFSQGTAAVLVTLGKIHDEDPQTFRFVAGVNVRGQGIQPCELDAIVLVGNRVIVVEAKSSGAIDAAQIDGTLRVARAIDAEVVFATLGTWSVETKQLVLDRVLELTPDLSVQFFDRGRLLSDLP